MERSISSFFRIVKEFKSKNNQNSKLTVIYYNYGLGLTAVRESMRGSSTSHGT